MPCLLKLLLLSLVVYANNCALANVASIAMSSKDYINLRLRETRDSLLDAVRSEALASEDEVWMGEASKWKNVWSSRPSERQQQQPRAVNLFDETLIIDERQVLSVALNLDEASNKREEHQLNLASPNQTIKLIKSCYFENGLSLLLVCQMSYCTHYQAVNSSTLQHRQAIEHYGFAAIDAAFFTHADKPHLVIAYNFSDDYSDGGLASSKIYQWNGTRMLYLEDIIVPNPKSVLTFKNGQSTVILFTLEPNHMSDSACAMYELYDENLLRRIRSTANLDPAIIAIYPYNYAEQQYFLTLDNLGSAQILHWNGIAFEKIANLPNIRLHAANPMRVVQLDNEALLFISDENELYVYRLKDNKVELLDDVTLPSGQRVAEITAWKYADMVMLLLVKINADDTFQTELWQVNLRVEHKDVYEEVWSCLRELKDALDSRAAIIENFQIAQSGDSFNLKINDGNIELVEFRKQLNTSVASPWKTKENLMELRENVIALKSNMLKNGASIKGNAKIAGDANIEELRIDNLEAKYINGELADFENYLISGIDQQFSMALNVKKVSIDDLNIHSLCGYGSDHWMQVNDSVRSHLKNINSSSISNDTIVIESQLIMERLNTRRINGIDWKDFLENLFTIGKEQVIRGNVRYEGIVQVTSLYSDKVNNVSSSELISKTSNQSLKDVFIDRLEVEQLYVEKINGVAIDKAARMSTKNLIKGKLTLAKLVITDELSVKENIALPLTHSTQVYDQIYIDGDVFVKNLELEERTSLNISGEILQASVRDLVANSWTKSSAQIIEAPISLQRGASIDRLNCLYLNDLAEHDFLYTDSTQLSDLDNVTFVNFHFNNVASESSESASFVEETNDYLTFHRGVRMRHLAVDNVFTDKYNGIPIESIMRSNEDLLPLPDEFNFETVRVEAEMSVDEVRASRLNGKSVTEAFSKALRSDRQANLNYLSARGDEAHFASQLRVRKLNGHDLERAIQRMEELSSKDSISRLTLESDMTIEEGLQVDRINNEEASDYISRMRDGEASSFIEIKRLVNLTVVENFEVGQLNGQKLDDHFFASALSRTKRQTLNGRVTFVDAQINYLTADAINNLDLSRLIYVDQPVTVIRGNVSFSQLHVQGDVTSQTFNGQNSSELVRKLHRLPTSNIDNLLVQADVNWDEPSSNVRSLTHLLDNAVTMRDDQLIASPITFEKSLVVEYLHLSNGTSEICRKISQIISDTVLDTDGAASDPIIVQGTKIFKQPLIVDDLQVDGNVDIKIVNGLDIRQVSSQIFQKDRAEFVSGDITFLDTIEIGRLLTNTDKIHGVALSQLAVVGQKMPKKLQFQHLHVDGNVSLYKLDGIDFDDFIKRRVTIDQDNEIFVDAEFVHSVQVLNNTVVASINQIKPENLVQNNADGVPIIVHGNKIFHSKLIIERNLETPLVNNFDVNSMYDNAVLNGTNVNILGSLVFEKEVEMYGNLSISGEFNGLKLQPSSEIKYWENQLLRNTLNKETFLLNGSLNEIEKQSTISLVLYLEEENKLNWHFAGIQSIKSLTIKNRTQLEIIIEETAELCGLRDDCSCRKEYVIEVLPSGEYEIQEQNVNNVSNCFYPADGSYGLKIISRSVSYSQQCSIDEREHSKIFWFKFDGFHESLRRTPALIINGYISDAQAFQIDNQLYLIVAIFYDKETKNHATDSLLYRFDLTNGKPVLAQKIPTDGAKMIKVFEIKNVGMHLLIGCVKGRAESLLLRFNPITQQFQMIRTFATGGSKYVASVSSNDRSFVILSNPDVRALQIFNYEHNTDTFVDYQILFFESRVTSLGVFYSRDFGQSDAFVVTTTKDGWLYIYEYMLYGKFQLKMSHWAEDIQVLTPFRHMNENYLFAGFKFNSTVYKVIQQEY